MRTFSINTLGCKVNQYETQQIRELLGRFGLRAAGPAEKPDLTIVNTCCVTHIASAKSRQRIRQARRRNPDAIVLVCGCLPTVQTGELSTPAKNVHLVRNRGDLVATLSQIAKGKPAAAARIPRSGPNTAIKAENAPEIKPKNALAAGTQLPPITCFEGQTRAFLKIQDGCDGYCTYCIVPKTRPLVRSKPAREALLEAHALVQSGHREIVLTGVFLGAYGQPTVRRKNWPNHRNDHLAQLLDQVAQIPGLERIRLSSLEPADVTARLLDTFSRHRNIMPHLHLSLQSGSNAVLKKMCRQYGADEFREKVVAIRSVLDRPAITTDIIVGFPGETQADFEETIALARDVGFAKMHVFSFSPRTGTAAAGMHSTVNTRVKKNRSKILHDLDIELGPRYRQQFIGETTEILLESDNGQFCGRSERYFMVCLDATAKNLSKNDLVRARLVDNGKYGMVGAVLTQQQWQIQASPGEQLTGNQRHNLPSDRLICGIRASDRLQPK